MTVPESRVEAQERVWTHKSLCACPPIRIDLISPLCRSSHATQPYPQNFIKILASRNRSQIVSILVGGGGGKGNHKVLISYVIAFHRTIFLDGTVVETLLETQAWQWRSEFTMYSLRLGYFWEEYCMLLICFFFLSPATASSWSYSFPDLKPLWSDRLRARYTTYYGSVEVRWSLT